MKFLNLIRWGLAGGVLVAALGCGSDDGDAADGPGGGAGEAGQGGNAGQAGQGGNAGQAGQGGSAGQAGQGGHSGGGAGTWAGGGNGGYGGDGGDYCNLSHPDGQCDDCIKTNCQSSCIACTNNVNCSELVLCIMHCSSALCEQDCIAHHPNGAEDADAFYGSQGCAAVHCGSGCVGGWTGGSVSPENTEARCADGFDNDGDGHIDCDDDDCSRNPNITVCGRFGENTDDRCSDGFDNDDDGLVDCDDDDCSHNPNITVCGTSGESTNDRCSDGFDNDSDGHIDCDDDDCSQNPAILVCPGGSGGSGGGGGAGGSGS